MILPILLALFLGACTSEEKPEGAQIEGRDMTLTDGKDKIATVRADELDSRGLPSILTDSKSVLSRRSIYFDYDRYDIRPEYQDLIVAHAKFLAQNPGFKMLIQGNTDERGSSEYNLALGQKRADAVKRALLLLGVKEDQVESVSLGKEKPQNLGHDENAWAENRRSDMLYRNDQQKRGEF